MLDMESLVLCESFSPRHPFSWDWSHRARCSSLHRCNCELKQNHKWKMKFWSVPSADEWTGGPTIVCFVHNVRRSQRIFHWSTSHRTSSSHFSDYHRVDQSRQQPYAEIPWCAIWCHRRSTAFRRFRISMSNMIRIGPVRWDRARTRTHSLHMKCTLRMELSGSDWKICVHHTLKSILTGIRLFRSEHDFRQYKWDERTAQWGCENHIRS